MIDPMNDLPPPITAENNDRCALKMSFDTRRALVALATGLQDMAQLIGNGHVHRLQEVWSAAAKLEDLLLQLKPEEDDG